MGLQVVATAMMSCSFGAAPSTLIVVPAGRPLAGGLPAANIMDFAPVANVPPFGMCNTVSNPTVASATAAALGVLTPMPCVPVTTGPWAPGCPKVLVSGMPALNDSSKCMCAWGGVISITNPGQTTTQIP